MSRSGAHRMMNINSPTPDSGAPSTMHVDYSHSLTSGFYVGSVRRRGIAGSNQIPFVVKDLSQRTRTIYEETRGEKNAFLARMSKSSEQEESSSLAYRLAHITNANNTAGHELTSFVGSIETNKLYVDGVAVSGAEIDSSFTFLDVNIGEPLYRHGLDAGFALETLNQSGFRWQRTTIDTTAIDAFKAVADNSYVLLENVLIEPLHLHGVASDRILVSKNTSGSQWKTMGELGITTSGALTNLTERLAIHDASLIAPLYQHGDWGKILVSIDPSFEWTDTPTAATAAANTRTTQLATTAFVHQEVDASFAALDAFRAAASLNVLPAPSADSGKVLTVNNLDNYVLLDRDTYSLASNSSAATMTLQKTTRSTTSPYASSTINVNSTGVLPPFSSNNGKFLAVDATSSGVEWVSAPSVDFDAFKTVADASAVKVDASFATLDAFRAAASLNVLPAPSADGGKVLTVNNLDNYVLLDKDTYSLASNSAAAIMTLRKTSASTTSPHASTTTDINTAGMLPSFSSNNGKFLAVDATSSGVEWVTAPTTGLENIPVEFDYDCSFERIPFDIGKGRHNRLDRSRFFTWQSNDSLFIEQHGDELVNAAFKSTISNVETNMRFRAGKFYKFILPKAYAVNEITLFYNTTITRILDQQTFQVHGSNDLTNRGHLSDYTDITKLVESEDHRKNSVSSNTNILDGLVGTYLSPLHQQYGYATVIVRDTDNIHVVTGQTLNKVGTYERDVDIYSGSQIYRYEVPSDTYSIVNDEFTVAIYVSPQFTARFTFNVSTFSTNTVSSGGTTWTFNSSVVPPDHGSHPAYMGAWECVNVPAPYYDNDGTSWPNIRKLTVRLLNDINEYRKYIFDCTMMTSDLSGIKLMHIDYRAAHEGDYTISSAEMEVNSLVVDDGVFKQYGGSSNRMSVRIKPCVPIPVKARGVVVTLTGGFGRQSYSGFRTTHVSPEYIEVATTGVVQAEGVTGAEISTTTPISIRGNLQHHLTIKATTSVVTHDLFLLGSTSSVYLSTINQWYLSQEPSSLTYITNMTTAPSTAPSSSARTSTPYFGSRTIPGTAETVIPTHRIGGTIKSADKHIGFVDVVQDNYRRVRVLAFATSHYWDYNLDNAGRLLAPFSETSSGITAELSSTTSDATVVSYGPIVRGALGAGAGGEEKCSVSFGRMNESGVERDFASNNKAEPYANATPVRKTYWQCPKDGPLIVFFAQAIPAGGKWHGQSRLSYKLQCKRIRLKSFVNAPKKGAIYGVDKLDSTTVAGDWKKIHDWDNASRPSNPYSTFPGDATWCFANNYSSSESDINDTTHDYRHDGTNYHSNTFFNFIVMVVEEVHNNGSKDEFFDLGLSSAAGCFLKFRYQMTQCFKSIA